jgi:G3E family GTPase
MDTVEAAVRLVNASADVRRTCRSEVSTDWVLDANSFSVSDLSRVKSALDSAMAAQGHPQHSAEAGHSCQSSDCSMSHDHSHSQDQPHSAATLSTHGFSFEGHIDLARLKILLDQLLYSYSLSVPGGAHSAPAGTSGDGGAMGAIYRMKGVFHVKGDDRLHILQAVHDIFDIQPSSFLVGSEQDASTGGCNKVIAIGKNIDSVSIERELKKCIVVD